MEAHHQISNASKGLDIFPNLALVTGDVHKLINATDQGTIRKYMDKLKDVKLNSANLNKFAHWLATSKSYVGNI